MTVYLTTGSVVVAGTCYMAFVTLALPELIVKVRKPKEVLKLTTASAMEDSEGSESSASESGAESTEEDADTSLVLKSPVKTT